MQLKLNVSILKAFYRLILNYRDSYDDDDTEVEDNEETDNVGWC